MTNQIICGDAYETLKKMESSSVNCIMFSPPYWSQRDYKVEGQIGLEETYQEWLEKMWAVMDELWRVLREDGTCWVNLGDKYNGNKKGKTDYITNPLTNLEQSDVIKHLQLGIQPKSLLFLPERFAIGCLERGWCIPNKNIWHKPNPMPSSGKGRFTNTWEYLYFMVKNTKPIMWIHRYMAEMVSKKPKDRTKTPCPECDGSGTSIVTLWESSLFPETAQVECSECRGKGEVSIWRSEDYWFDLDAVRRPHKESSIERNKYPCNAIPRSWREGSSQSIPISGGKKPIWNLSPAGKNPGDVMTTKIPEEDAEKMASPRARQWRRPDEKRLHTFYGHSKRGKEFENPAGANPGDFWSIPTQPSKLEHYAAFPEALVRTPLKAGCPRWICKECGMARCRVTKPSEEYKNKMGVMKSGNLEKGFGASKPTTGARLTADYHTLGWSFCSCLCPACGQADCKCGAKWRPGIVLDPFCGTGTTLKVAKELGFDYYGIDIKQEYVDLSKKRLKDVHFQEALEL